jgi:hypothetical protein
VKRLQDELDACLYPDLIDGVTWRELFTPAWP